VVACPVERNNEPLLPELESPLPTYIPPELPVVAEFVRNVTEPEIEPDPLPMLTFPPIPLGAVAAPPLKDKLPPTVVPDPAVTATAPPVPLVAIPADTKTFPPATVAFPAATETFPEMPLEAGPVDKINPPDGPDVATPVAIRSDPEAPPLEPPFDVNN